MTDIVQGMADTYTKHSVIRAGANVSMRAALLWLANNVSDEMARAAYRETRETTHLNNMHESIAAAIRAAAGGEG